MLRLRELRQQRNMSLRTLARISGVSKSYISKLESGEIKDPGFHTVYQLSKALKIPPCKLMGVGCPFYVEK